MRTTFYSPGSFSKIANQIRWLNQNIKIGLNYYEYLLQDSTYVSLLNPLSNSVLNEV